MKRLAATMLVAALVCFAAAAAGGAELKGSSTTLPYYFSESYLGDDYAYLALYEFADIGVYDVGTPGLDFYFAGWGRLDTLDKLDPEDEAVGDADLASAYIRWQHPDRYLDVSLGRRFVVVGPVAQRIDSLMLETEPVRGFGLQVFGGMPVVSRLGERDGDFGFGGRLYGRCLNYFEIGASAAAFTEGGDPDRQIFGGDISVFPAAWMDILGHGYYDMLYGSLYDADGQIVVRPVTDLRVLLQYQRIMPSAYLGMNSIFSVFTFNTISKYIAEARYTILRRVVISGQFDHYNYDEDDPANRGGGSVGVLWGKNRNDTFDLGLFKLDKEDNGYTEMRAYFYQNLGKHLYMALDGIAYQLDEEVYNVDQGFYGTGSLGWHIRPDLDLQASGFYLTSPFYESDVRGLIKLAYNFDKVF